MHKKHQLLQELFREGNHQQSPPEFNPQPYAITSQDENFMKKVLVMIEENMENSEMTVEELGQNMMMSRSVFFKKIKALTGFAPVEFIRDMKMKRAAQILSSGQYMVKEVSYLIGISDTKYFAKCFKAKYGVTPLEYKNRKGE
jgi:AraC-like DNA-binding protein